jgi:hypothetical protein
VVEEVEEEVEVEVAQVEQAAKAAAAPKAKPAPKVIEAENFGDDDMSRMIESVLAD